MIKIRSVDNGPGIAPEFHHRTSERFFRVDPGRSREAEGQVWFAIVKDLVEKMAGRVWVECPERAGSIFCMTFAREIAS